MGSQHAYTEREADVAEILRHAAIIADSTPLENSMLVALWLEDAAEFWENTILPNSRPKREFATHEIRERQQGKRERPMSAKSQVGESGHPGDQYDIIQFELERLGLDTYEARAGWRKGSNQGHCLEDYSTLTGRHRSTAPAAAILGLLEDVLNWDTGHAEGLIRSAIKDCLYDFEDQEN